jgi:oligopeptide transport system ATP-binding protein
MNNIKNKKCNINNNYLDDNNSFIKAVNIKKYFRMSSKKCLRAVDDVSLDIKQNQIVSLIGESGSGKSTFGKTLIRLYEPTSGEIFVENKNITHAKLIPHKKIQMIFQNPLFSLNPRMTIGEIIQEPLDIYKIFDNDKEKKERVSFLLESVGLNAKYVNRYPHEFSGGQQQRICIARALAVEPKFIVCDEPTSALDISVQSQIINMLKDIQVRLKLSYLFISHDISIAKYISDVIAVMYLGNILELMSSKELDNNS